MWGRPRLYSVQPTRIRYLGGAAERERAAGGHLVRGMPLPPVEAWSGHHANVPEGASAAGAGRHPGGICTAPPPNSPFLRPFRTVRPAHPNARPCSGEVIQRSATLHYALLYLLLVILFWICMIGRGSTFLTAVLTSGERLRAKALHA